MLFGRRDFIRIGSLGALGVSLDNVLRAGGKKDISCILVWQSGGCAHQDTFDMKPEAPLEYRGEFRAIPTHVPGIRICEHLPRLARQADKFTILRSMRSDETNHELAAKSLLARRLPGITLPVDVDWSEVGSRRWLGEQAEAIYRAAEAHSGFEAADEWQQRAWDLVSSPATKKAFDIEAESPSLRERYGRTPVGQGCLLARRLVQHGARFVTVSKGALEYDTHADHFRTMRDVLLPEFDRAFAALLEDLDERGLLASTLVIAMGEFGRTPRINNNGGRDHHAGAWSICLAGAGIPGGRILGATDTVGAEITDLPVAPDDLVRSVYAILGVNTAGPRIEGLLG